MRNLFFLFCTMFMGFIINAQEKINFKSSDSLELTADWFPINGSAKIMLLLHQANSSRGEYRNIAPKLNELGFSCLAVDLRSGHKMQGIENETAKRASIKKLKTSYLEAEKDILASIDYLYKKYQKPIILFGSSYSASLALKIANKNDKILAVIAFSPGEYFDKELNVKEVIKDFDKPAFLTSSLQEVRPLRAMLGEVMTDKIYYFIPKGEGNHGARALFRSNPNNEEYWNALKNFLNEKILK